MIVIKNKKNGYIYFIFNDGLIKIGRTNNYKRRLREFKTTMPYMRILQILYYEDMIKAEKYFHDRYKSVRVKGEWFMPVIMKEKGMIW